ncbi:MAG: hypothetical protein IKR11_11610 [Solobacterium sp.]|nr:hypothetical protein [Solobacterium sp.]
MRNVDSESIFVVDYESGSSVIHEFMSSSDYLNLLENERMGYVKIMHHENLGSVA